jgi:hypothetical protein
MNQHATSIQNGLATHRTKYHDSMVLVLSKNTRYIKAKYLYDDWMQENPGYMPDSLRSTRIQQMGKIVADLCIKWSKGHPSSGILYINPYWDGVRK